VQIVFTTVGYINLDHLSRKTYYTNCAYKVKIYKILNGVLLFTICKYESRYRLVVFGAMGYCIFTGDPKHFNLLKPTGYVMHHQFNIQQLYALPTLYLCVLCLSENKQRLVPLTALTDWFL